MRKKKRNIHKSGKMRSGTALHVRCKYCREEFTGKSDEVLKEWGDHFTLCEKKHKRS